LEKQGKRSGVRDREEENSNLKMQDGNVFVRPRGKRLAGNDFQAEFKALLPICQGNERL